MADETRHSKALDAQIITDPDELARKESFNVIAQYRAIAEMVETYLEPERPFKLRPSHLLHLHRAALDGISSYAGNFRPAGIEIGKSKHEPPPAHRVPELVEELCDYVNEKWAEKSPIHLAAYVMWRLNWIHPFTDGNGRTSRAVSYLVLCIRLHTLLPGKLTIPEQIEQDRTPYYRALETADVAWAERKIDLTKMKELLGSMLAKQLYALYELSDFEEEKSTAAIGQPSMEKLVRRELYAMIVINPISFPDDLEIRVVPLSRENEMPIGGSLTMREHRSWEWVRNHYPVRADYLEEVEGYLKAGQAANLVRGETVVNIPEDMKFPES
jgi:Fic family protein